MNDALLIFYLRPARREARWTATAEALSLLSDLSATAPAGGPLSDEGGLFWISLPIDALDRARARFPLLGYTHAVDMLEPVGEREPIAQRRSFQTRLVRWRRRPFRLVRLYEEQAEAVRESAPDRRAFVLETADGALRKVRGYRGNSRPLSRRGLPVPDARMLANLVCAQEGGIFLDPFAGVGGILLETLGRHYQLLSCDRDPALRHGLAASGAMHFVADARRLPLRAGSIDAIATEPPYEMAADEAVFASLEEMGRVLKAGGRIAVLCAIRQAEGIQRRAVASRLTIFHESAINRKETDCAVLAWEKS